MTTTPPEAPSSGPNEPPEPPYAGGPRVTREEAKDLGRIRRSTTDRKVAGVAAGVARHFDIDPLLVRVAFVLLAIFGGGGILAYIAGWLLIPEEGSDEGTIRVDDRARTVLLTVVAIVTALSLVGDSLGGWDFPWPLAIIGLVIAAVAAASRPRQHPGPLPSSGWIPPGTPGQVPGAQTGYGATYDRYHPGPRPRPVDSRRRGPVLFWFTMALAGVLVALVGTLDLAGWDAPPSAYPAAVLAACGAMLLVGAFWGRAGGLILVGLLAAFATLVTSVVQDLSAGEVKPRLTSAAEVDDRYELGAGEMILDLTTVEDLVNLDGRTIKAEVMFGHLVVIVPDDGMEVAVTSQVEGGGESVLFGERTDGSDEARYDEGDIDLTLDLEVVFGQIEVQTKEAS